MSDPAIQDYSAWLTPERLAAEEDSWRNTAIYRLYASELLRLIADTDSRSVLEIGCGTGWIPACLPPWIDYTGVDANGECLALARTKTDRPFVETDIRTLETDPRDVVCAFAVMKHFALHEWPQILHRVLSFGLHGLFTMNVASFDADDFSQGFPHTWVSFSTLDAAIDLAGHEIVGADRLHTGETMVWTTTPSA